jgi:addiction module HigA family antidote
MSKSSITTELLPAVHPGEVLEFEFMQELGLSQNALARNLGVPPRRVNEIVHGRRAITADTALRLSRFFGTSAQFWMNLQSKYDLDTVEDGIAEQLSEITPFALA